MSVITVFTSTRCPYCHSAIALLEERKLRFRTVNVMTSPINAEEFHNRTKGARSVPQVLVDDTLIGGYDRLKAVIDTPEFQQMIGGQ